MEGATRAVKAFTLELEADIVEMPHFDMDERVLDMRVQKMGQTQIQYIEKVVSV